MRTQPLTLRVQRVFLCENIFLPANLSFTECKCYFLVIFVLMELPPTRAKVPGFLMLMVGGGGGGGGGGGLFFMSPFFFFFSKHFLHDDSIAK